MEGMKEESKEEKQQEKTKPMGAELNAAKAEIMIGIMQVQTAYGLPAYLTDLLVSACLADIKECAKQDLIATIE